MDEDREQTNGKESTKRSGAYAAHLSREVQRASQLVHGAHDVQRGRRDVHDERHEVAVAQELERLRVGYGYMFKCDMSKPRRLT